MFNKLKRFIARKIIQFINEYNERNCYLVSTAFKGTYLEEAKVVNFQNDISKIFVEENTRIRGELLVFGYGGKITIGKNTYIGNYSKIWSGEEIFIGNNVLLSHNVNVVDTNSHEIDHIERAQGYVNLLSKGHPKEKGSILTKPIRIEDYCWISFNATILKGVTIGKGSIVAANSVVTKDVPEFTMVAGNPAKIIKYLK